MQVSGGSWVFRVAGFEIVDGPQKTKLMVQGLGFDTSSGSIARRFLSRISVPREVRPEFWGWGFWVVDFRFWDLESRLGVGVWGTEVGVLGLCLSLGLECRFQGWGFTLDF